MKDDSVCLLNDEKSIFQEKNLENVMNDNETMNENVEKVLWLTTEILEKGRELKWW